MRVATWAENHAWLTERFLARLFALRPTSVLDVGCGEGELLREPRIFGEPLLHETPIPIRELVV